MDDQTGDWIIPDLDEVEGADLDVVAHDVVIALLDAINRVCEPDVFGGRILKVDGTRLQQLQEAVLDVLEPYGLYIRPDDE